MENPFQKMKHLHIPDKLKKGSYAGEIAFATELMNLRFS